MQKKTQYRSYSDEHTFGSVKYVRDQVSYEIYVAMNVKSWPFWLPFRACKCQFDLSSLLEISMTNRNCSGPNPREPDRKFTVSDL